MIRAGVVLWVVRPGNWKGEVMTEKHCSKCENEKSFYPTNLCDKHNVCLACGIKRADLKEIPWGKVLGWQCKPCELTERKAGIEKRQTDGFDHEYTDEVVCPHCGYEFSDSWEMGDNDDGMDCPDCEKTFSMERIVTCEYSTDKKP